MPELDTFDARLERAVHAFADRALTSLDAVAVAERAIGRRRTGVWSVLGRSVPVPVSILVLAALLLAIFAWSLQVGARWDGRNSVVVAPTATPAPTVPAATPTLMPAPGRSPDGEGDEVVEGTESVVVTTEYTEVQVGQVQQLRGGVVTTTAVMNDPRVSGTGTWQTSVDAYTTVGPQWGTYRLENATGAWEGTCSGGTWDAGDGAMRTCWLTGSGAYAGYSYFLYAAWTTPGPGRVQGVIYPGSPSEP